MSFVSVDIASHWAKAVTIALSHSISSAGSAMAHVFPNVSVLKVVFVAIPAMRFCPVYNSVNRINEPSFADGVSHIVGVCSEKQMGWVYARRVVAMMANVYALWDKTNINKITIPMGKHGPGICSRTMNSPVAVMGFGTQPNPTFIGTAALNLFPESIFHRAALPGFQSFTPLSREVCYATD